MLFEEFQDGRWPSGISERNDFSTSEALCCYDASHKISAQYDLWFGRRCRLKNNKMDAVALLHNDRRAFIVQ